MMKYGFLFGAGAEVGYNLPSGGRFALDIFRQDITEPKKVFRKMRDQIDNTTIYASTWLPTDYIHKSISAFGKSVYTSIISSTVEHNRDHIVNTVNNFDTIGEKIANKLKAQNVDFEESVRNLTDREVSGISFKQKIQYHEAFEKGNKLFNSNYFSSLLMVYSKAKPERIEQKRDLRTIIVAIMQLQLGALSEELKQDLNENLFMKKDEDIDLFDDFGELIRLNYSASGTTGMEYLLDGTLVNPATDSDYDVVLYFAYKTLEDLYASVLDYKSLIDSYWHYLYCPKSDWAKFCKISIFLITVQQYICGLGKNAKRDNADGYYNMLQAALNEKWYEVSTIATTNYNELIGDILTDTDIMYLNGSVKMYYDPYINKIGSKEELDNDEHHILVPLIFTQSGTKPMTSIRMSERYVQMYQDWEKSDAIVIVGFGFGTDDEHINGILRTLHDDDKKDLIVVSLANPQNRQSVQKDIRSRLKLKRNEGLTLIPVDENGYFEGKAWTQCLLEIKEQP